MADPQRIGKYEVLGVLGKGAMGVVYKGFDPQVERTVAIKTVRRDLVDPDILAQTLSRFQNEARAAGRLLHPNIVTIYEFGEDGSTAFIAMEYVEGTGLREYLNRKTKLPLPQVASVMSQLLLALHFAHERRVIHRDIKPANLILTAEGVLKVADFGIARIDTSKLTSVGMVIGTPSYMSPEQCQGLAVDHRSDLFSAGVVLYELLVGQPPWSGALESIIYKICREEAPAPSAASTIALSPAVDGLLAKALAKNPQQRFASGREFRHALRLAFALPHADPDDDADDRTRLDVTNISLQPALVPAWEDTVLSTVERQLASFVGPMAKVMVRKAASRAHDLAGLYALLSENIGSAGERQRFVEGLRGSDVASATHPSRSTAPGSGTHAAPPPGPAATGGGAHPPLDQAFVDEIAGRLAVYVGPIAKVLARKAAQKASTRQDFVRLVSEHLGVQDRGAFLRDVGFPGHST
jgi:serine/threonine-protein kinase